MTDPTARRFFVLTKRGDRGPLDREGLRQLLRDGDAVSDDLVRNLFGQMEGTVGDIVKATSEGSDRQRRNAAQARSPGVTSTQPSGPLPLILVALVSLLLGAILFGLYLVWTPRPSAENEPRQVISPVVAPAQQTRPPVTPSPPEADPKTPVASKSAVVDPFPWVSYNFGGTLQGGSPIHYRDTWKLFGTGKGVAGVQDQCLFAAIPLVGDGAISVCVNNFERVQQYGGAGGLMIRSAATADAPCVFLKLDASGEVSYFVRRGPTDHGIFGTTDKLSCPGWLRLERRGTYIGSRLSQDGKTWNNWHTQQIEAFTGPVLVGLVVYSGDETKPASAYFRKFVVEPATSAP